GVHCSVSGGLHNAFIEATELGIDTFQIFTQNQRQWINKRYDQETISAFKTAWKNSSVKTVFSHCSYLLNLASEDEVLQKKSIDALIGELQRCNDLGLSFCVLHPGAAKGQSEKDALTNVVNALKTVLDATKDLQSGILIENTAGQGTSIGHSFEQLSIILKGVDSRRLGVCFDTCHAFAAGYDLRTAETFDATWRIFDTLVGRKNLKAIHLNDSKGDLGSRIDRHDHIGHGKLGLDTFRRMINEFPDVPKVLETEKEDDWDLKNLELLHSLS
ncbi:MAG: deoxyribonuclease IV, partial [Bacteroidota bacterium]